MAFNHAGMPIPASKSCSRTHAAWGWGTFYGKITINLDNFGSSMGDCFGEIGAEILILLAHEGVHLLADEAGHNADSIAQEYIARDFAASVAASSRRDIYLTGPAAADQVSWITASEDERKRLLAKAYPDLPMSKPFQHYTYTQATSTMLTTLPMPPPNDGTIRPMR